MQIESSVSGRRGARCKTERNVAIWLAVTWFEEVEGLSAFNACEAARDIWVRHGFIGLGGPHSHSSRAIYPILRAAAHRLGPGQALTWPGVEVQGDYVGACAAFVPEAACLHWVGTQPVIEGDFWLWELGEERARFCEGLVPYRVTTPLEAGELDPGAGIAGRAASVRVTGGTVPASPKLATTR